MGQRRLELGQRICDPLPPKVVCQRARSPTQPESVASLVEHFFRHEAGRLSLAVKPFNRARERIMPRFLIRRAGAYVVDILLLFLVLLPVGQLLRFAIGWPTASATGLEVWLVSA